MSKVWYVVAIAAIVFTTAVFLSAQTGSQGTITITVVDQSGGVVPGVDLTLQDLATNDVRKGASQSNGSYNFVGLNVGTYKLSAVKTGYASVVYDSVTVHAARVTDITATLKLATIMETVEVKADEAPLVDSTSSSIGVTIDLKQIEDLPITGRDIFPLVTLAAGWTNTPAQGTGAGTFNGLPGGAIIGANIDGVPAIPGRMRSGGYSTAGTTAVETRLENISEMTVQTDQIDLSQGFGSDVQINFVTRRGSNRFHGRAFDNFQNDGLNANSWYNDAINSIYPGTDLRKSKLIKNDFGFSMGGPIFKDKLFFFGSYSEFKQPGTTLVSNNVLTPAAQAGNIIYQDANGNNQPAVNVITIAQQAGLYSTFDATVAAQQANINSSLKTPGASVVLPTAGQDPNIETVKFPISQPTVNYYPAIRLDYDLSQKQRLFGAWNFTKMRTQGIWPQSFPGSSYAWQTSGFFTKDYTTAIGYDWTVKPTLINQFRAGFLYNSYTVSPEANSNPAADREMDNTIWAIGASGSYPVLAQTGYYPLFNVSDTVTWQFKAHAISFGFQGYREQDHFWNPPLGWSYDDLGVVSGDPAANTFVQGASSLPNIAPNWVGEVQNLYATLTGDMYTTWGQRPVNSKDHQFDKQYGAYNLDELLQASGLFFQDSYRVRPNLTLNYGIRWDFVGDDHDLGGVYHGSSLADIYGPSGIGNEFKPGTLTGTEDPLSVASSHQYNAFHKTPQPSIGIAWSPNFSNGFLAKLTGGPGQTVVRAGYSLRDYLEGQQAFWAYASDFGNYFYQVFTRSGGPSANASTGTYLAGTFHLEDDIQSCKVIPQTVSSTCPPFITAPTTYTNVAHLADLAWTGMGMAGINPHIKVPYIQSWNLGIERSLGRHNALELRYVGNRGVHEWIAPDLNEVNIFENGFLTQFKTAQQNLNIYTQANPGCVQAGTCSFANNGLPGQQAIPIFQAAFSQEGAGLGPGAGDYTNGNFVSELLHGAAGSLAQALAGNSFYLCSMVGTSFGPCATAGFTNAGTYPSNFFQVNPFTAGLQDYYLNATGYSNYNALQVEFRQKNWHGMQFNANYTWGKTLGTSPQGNNSGQVNYYTLRNQRMNYQPSAYDIRQNFNAFGTYDLPFGAGKTFLNRQGALDRLVGGWTLGTIFKFQTGNPFQLYGGYNTFNDYSDGGVNLTNITAKQLQHDVGVWRVPGQPFVDTFNPNIIATNNATANPNFLTPNTTPGTLAPRIWLYGPHYTNTDLSISKRIPIRAGISGSIQGEFLNAFNHPSFGNPGSGVNSGGFGEAGTVNGPRAIELRANIEF